MIQWRMGFNHLRYGGESSVENDLYEAVGKGVEGDFTETFLLQCMHLGKFPLTAHETLKILLGDVAVRQIKAPFGDVLFGFGAKVNGILHCLLSEAFKQNLSKDGGLFFNTFPVDG
jgi:hypothetical protein